MYVELGTYISTYPSNLNTYLERPIFLPRPNTYLDSHKRLPTKKFIPYLLAFILILKSIQLNK
jgi:hypothetical protein